jgi:hypothetical protein
MAPSKGYGWPFAASADAMEETPAAPILSSNPKSDKSVTFWYQKVTDLSLVANFYSGWH